MSGQKWGVFLLLLASSVKAQDLEFGNDQDDAFALEANDYGDDEDYEDFPCGIDYYDHDFSDQCHHDEFPSESLQDVLGSKVKTCCSDHGYIFAENCEADVSPTYRQIRILV